MQDPLCLAVYQNRSVEKIYDIKVLRKLGKKQKWRKSLQVRDSSNCCEPSLPIIFVYQLIADSIQGLQRYIVPEVHSVGIYESNRKKVKLVSLRI